MCENGLAGPPGNDAKMDIHENDRVSCVGNFCGTIRFLSEKRECRLADQHKQMVGGHMPLESGNTTPHKHITQQDQR